MALSPTADYQTNPGLTVNEVYELFTSIFTSSEGDEESKLIGNFALELSSNIGNQEIICVDTYEKKDHSLVLCSSHAFGLMNPWVYYMLTPVAVSTDHQGKSTDRL